MQVVSVKQMTEIESSANAGGISYEQMMRNAGNGMADWLFDNVDLRGGSIGLVGSGNNGGDTLIALTACASHGVRTMAFAVKARPEDDPLVSAYKGQGGNYLRMQELENFDVFDAAVTPQSLILDGILGTGLKLPVRGELRNVMAKIAGRLKKRPECLKIAVDCPSGVDCDTGNVSEVTFPADHTLCMAAIKQGLLKPPARDYCGVFHPIDIGIGSLRNHIDRDLPILVGEDLVRSILPARSSQGHKGTFGSVYVIAGTEAFTGAAFLAGKSAYRSGCGLVHLASTKDVHQHLSGVILEAVWTVLPDIHGAYDPKGLSLVAADLNNCDSLVIGPGWGQSDDQLYFLTGLLDIIPQNLPVLVDADALKLLSRIGRWWEKLPPSSILTPHPGEFAILTGLSVDAVQEDRWQMAEGYAKEWGVTVLLKGAISVLAAPDGALALFPFSDSALATAGSGDVLSGLIGGLMAQGLSPMASGVCGGWIHGKAGLAARTAQGQGFSVTALDMLDSISAGFPL